MDLGIVHYEVRYLAFYCLQLKFCVLEAWLHPSLIQTIVAKSLEKTIYNLIAEVFTSMELSLLSTQSQLNSFV